MRPKLFVFLIQGVALVLGGCESDPLRPPPDAIHARFDPTEGTIPMPTDILRDDDTGVLDLPTDDADLTPAEKEVYTFMNTLEGWPPSSGATVEFDAPLALNSVTAETIQVFEYKPNSKVGARFSGEVKLELSTDGKKVTIEPPEEGWPRGSTIAIVVRGGEKGVMGARGETVACDAAFYFLRLTTPLNVHEDYRAFPGATRKERERTARDLETIRAELFPFFQDLERRGIPRQEVASLWTFTIHKHTELAMDKASGKMPLPIDLLIDEQTGKVDLPIRDDDTETEKQAKKDLRDYDGFSTTASQLFEFTEPVDPATVTPETVQLYRVSDATQIPATVQVSVDDLVRVEVRPEELPLDAKTTYAVVVKQGVLNAEGKPVRPMLVGHFLRAVSPVAVAGISQVGSLDDETANKLEGVRARVSPLLDKLGRDKLLTAWPFTTLSVVEPMLRAVSAAERLGLPVEPKDIVEKSVTKAVGDFLIGFPSVFNVKRVFEGKIAIPDFLDPLTHKPYPDGKHVVRWVPFTLTIPDGATPDKPLPVVIFGHAICTEHRFVLGVADGMAKQGFAVIGIDLPFHGTRTACAWNGPICFPNPISDDGEMICPDPCPSDSTCSADGRCRDENGVETGLSVWPVIPMPQASGAAFLELDSIAGTMSHFSQAVTDLGALSRVVRKATWSSHIGYSFKTDGIYYLGQSLGGIIGATYVPLDPYVKRAVLNVPGGNLVPMFVDSLYFSTHVDAFLEREKITKGSPEHQRFMNIASWFVDPVDPINVARYLETEPLPGSDNTTNDREVLIQMATLDFIIPNTSTKHLASVGKVSRLDYVAEHAFLVIPFEMIPYIQGTNDAADFLAGSLNP